MDHSANTDARIAYETQARYAPDEEWVTLEVSVSQLPALDQAFVRHDPWGRRPTEIRVRSIHRRSARGERPPRRQ
jgi:hypothetical protein